MNSVVKQKKVKEVYEDVIDKHYCDLCGKELYYNGVHKEVDICCELDSYNYGSDGMGDTTLFFDVCKKCFLEKVVPKLKEIELKPMIEENNDGKTEFYEYKE